MVGTCNIKNVYGVVRISFCYLKNVKITLSNICIYHWIELIYENKEKLFSHDILLQLILLINI